jgi:hypothetical protein
VTRIEAGSPAADFLLVNDVILGTGDTVEKVTVTVPPPALLEYPKLFLRVKATE